MGLILTLRKALGRIKRRPRPGDSAPRPGSTTGGR